MLEKGELGGTWGQFKDAERVVKENLGRTKTQARLVVDMDGPYKGSQISIGTVTSQLTGRVHVTLGYSAGDGDDFVEGTATLTLDQSKALVTLLSGVRNA